MALILEANEACPHAHRCPHFKNGMTTCQGTNSNRGTRFYCNYVKEDGSIDRSGFRNSHDKTGKMTILVE